MSQKSDDLFEDENGTAASEGGASEMAGMAGPAEYVSEDEFSESEVDGGGSSPEKKSGLFSKSNLLIAGMVGLALAYIGYQELGGPAKPTETAGAPSFEQVVESGQEGAGIPPPVDPVTGLPAEAQAAAAQPTVPADSQLGQPVAQETAVAESQLPVAAQSMSPQPPVDQATAAPRVLEAVTAEAMPPAPAPAPGGSGFTTKFDKYTGGPAAPRAEIPTEAPAVPVKVASQAASASASSSQGHAGEQGAAHPVAKQMAPADVARLERKIDRLADTVKAIDGRTKRTAEDVGKIQSSLVRISDSIEGLAQRLIEEIKASMSAITVSAASKAEERASRSNTAAAPQKVTSVRPPRFEESPDKLIIAAREMSSAEDRRYGTTELVAASSSGPFAKAVRESADLGRPSAHVGYEAGTTFALAAAEELEKPRPFDPNQGGTRFSLVGVSENGQAWLVDERSPGKILPLRKGDMVPGYGRVTDIDPARAMVSTSSGAVFKAKVET